MKDSLVELPDDLTCVTVPRLGKADRYGKRGEIPSDILIAVGIAYLEPQAGLETRCTACKFKHLKGTQECQECSNLAGREIVLCSKTI